MLGICILGALGQVRVALGQLSVALGILPERVMSKLR